MKPQEKAWALAVQVMDRTELLTLLRVISAECLRRSQSAGRGDTG